MYNYPITMSSHQRSPAPAPVNVKITPKPITPATPAELETKISNFHSALEQADHSYLQMELPSSSPPVESLTMLFSRAKRLDFSKLKTQISQNSFQLLTDLLVANKELSEIIIDQTELNLSGKNIILELLRKVLKSGGYSSLSLTICNVQGKQMPYAMQKALLALFKEKPIASLTLVNVEMRIVAVCKAVSEHQYLKTLVLDGNLIELSSSPNTSPSTRLIPIAEPIEFSKHLFKNTSLTHTVITRAVPDFKYDLHEVTMQNVNNKLASASDDINLFTARNKLREVLNDNDIAIPQVLIFLILDYVQPSLADEKNDQQEDYQAFINELKSETSNLEKVKELLIRMKMTTMRFKEKELKISRQGIINLSNAFKALPQIDSFDFNHFNLFFEDLDHGIKTTYWGVVTILSRFLSSHPRALKFLDISNVNWNRRAGLCAQTSLVQLLPTLTHPIETLRLTYHQTTANNTIIVDFPDYHQPLLDLGKRDLVKAFDIRSMGVYISLFFEVLKDCKCLTSLNVNDNFVYLGNPGRFKKDTVESLIEKLEQNTSLTSIIFDRALIVESIVDWNGPGKPTPTQQAQLDEFNEKLKQSQDRIQAIASRNKALVDRDKIWDLAFQLLYMTARFPLPHCRLVLDYYDDRGVPRQNIYYRKATAVFDAYQEVLKQDRKLAPEDHQTLLTELQTGKSDFKVMARLFKDVTVFDYSDESTHLSDAGLTNLIKSLQRPQILSFIFNNADFYMTVTQANVKIIHWVTIYILWGALRERAHPLKLLDISRINWGEHEGSEMVNLNQLLPILNQPIEYLRLTDFTYSSTQLSTCFQSSLLTLSRKDLITDLDLTDMKGVEVTRVAKVIVDCKNLKSIRLDGNLVTRFNFVPEIIGELEKNNSLTSIDFKRAVRCGPGNEDGSWINAFNRELRDQQPRIRSLELRNRIFADRDKIWELTTQLLFATAIRSPSPLCLLVLSYYDNLGVPKEASKEFSFKKILQGSSPTTFTLSESKTTDGLPTALTLSRLQSAGPSPHGH